MIISSTDTSGKQALSLRLPLSDTGYEYMHIYNHTLLFTYCRCRPSFSFLNIMLLDRKESFSISDSLHSSLTARPIYSKRPKLIPMAVTSRNGLFHVVSPQKSLPEQEHRLYLIQIITRGLTNSPVTKHMWRPWHLSSHVPLPTKIKISQGPLKSYSVAFLISTSTPHNHSTAEAVVWEQTASLLLMGNMDHMKSDRSNKKRTWRWLRWDAMSYGWNSSAITRRKC